MLLVAALVVFSAHGTQEGMVGPPGNKKPTLKLVRGKHQQVVLKQE